MRKIAQIACCFLLGSCATMNQVQPPSRLVCETKAGQLYPRLLKPVVSVTESTQTTPFSCSFDETVTCTAEPFSVTTSATRVMRDVNVTQRQNYIAACLKK